MSLPLDPTAVMDALQACWCAQLQGSLGGPPALCCTTTGPPAIAECCSGFAWVRLVSAVPTAAFPTRLTVPQRCPAYTWALTVEVGITRCAPQNCGDDVLSNTCCESQAESAAILMDDFKQMRDLFGCGCLGISPDQILIGAYTVYGPEGGCVGSRITATINSQPI